MNLLNVLNSQSFSVLFQFREFDLECCNLQCTTQDADECKIEAAGNEAGSGRRRRERHLIFLFGRFVGVIAGAGTVKTSDGLGTVTTSEFSTHGHVKQSAASTKRVLA